MSLFNNLLCVFLCQVCPRWNSCCANAVASFSWGWSASWQTSCLPNLQSSTCLVMYCTHNPPWSQCSALNKRFPEDTEWNLAKQRLPTYLRGSILSQPVYHRQSSDLQLTQWNHVNYQKQYFRNSLVDLLKRKKTLHNVKISDIFITAVHLTATVQLGEKITKTLCVRLAW